MQIVTDNKGVAWEIAIDYEALRRVKTDTKIDLGLPRYPGPSGLPLSVELYDSPSSLLDVLWSICRPRAATKGINKAAFEAAFFGPQLNEGRAAFFSEWQLFFQSLQQTEEADSLKNFLTLIPLKKQQLLESQESEIGVASRSLASGTPASSESKASTN